MASSARAALKSVLRIHVKGYSESNASAALNPQELFSEDWVASAFFVKFNSEYGFILTNGHAARNGTCFEIQSILTSDEFFKLELVGVVEDLEPDVALLRFRRGEKKRFLKISGLKKIPCIPFGDSRKIRRGEEVQAIGHPLGMEEPHVSGGEISNFVAGSYTSIERLVTDAAINPGNSGGPALVGFGRVIGINTSIVMGANNVGFITPVHFIENLFKALAEKRKPGVCTLGVEIQKNSALNARFLKQRQPRGVIVKKVYPGGLAEKLGLRVRDQLISFCGHHLDRHGNIIGEKTSRKRNLFDLLHAIPLGNKISIDAHRNGKKLKLETKAFLGQDPGFPKIPIFTHRRKMSFGGMLLQEVCAELIDALVDVYPFYDRCMAFEMYRKSCSNIFLTHLEGASQAEELGIELGDFVTAVNSLPVSSLEQLGKCLESAYLARQWKCVISFASGSLGVFDLSKFKLSDFSIRRVGALNSD